jgi:hypothetical protein
MKRSQKTEMSKQFKSKRITRIDVQQSKGIDIGEYRMY